MQSQELSIVLKAQDEASSEIKKLKTSVDGLSGSAQQAGPSFGSMVGSFAAGGLVVGAVSAGVGMLKDAIMGSVAAAQEAELGQAQLGAVLQSTGMAAGVTAQAANDLAAALSESTTFSDDQILAAENLALTFTSINKDVFPETIATILDVSTAMGQDLKSSAIQLGKALNNPTEGVSALTRVGVNLTEQQKEQIETFQKNGDMMSAQKVILKELSTEFGGAAEAAANTYTGRMKQLNNSIGEVQENIGKALLPAMKPLVDLFLSQANAAQDASADSQGLAKVLYGVASVIKGLILVVIGIVKTIAAFAVQMAQTAMVAAAFAKDVSGAFIAVKNAAMGIFAGLAKAIQGDFAGAKEEISKALDFSVSLDNTRAAMGSFQSAIDSLSSSAVSSFKDAGVAFKEAFVQEGFVPVSNAVDATQRKVGAAGGTISNTSKKAAEELAKLTDKVKDMGEQTATKLTEIFENYNKKAVELLSNHKDKISEINKQIVNENESFDKQNLDSKAQYQKDVVSLFIDQQDKLKELQKDQAELQQKLAVETNPQNRKEMEDKLTALTTELNKQKTTLTQFQGEFTDIEKLAADERARTDLDRLKSRFDEETTERQREHDAKIADLLSKSQAELAAYQKAKEDLVADTIDKYQKINAETQKGWEKIIADTHIKVNEMQKLEQQVMSIKASIESARAAVSNAKGSSIPKLAEGGIVNKPTVAMIGEAGPEAVVPLSSLGAMGGVGQGIIINIGSFIGGNPEQAAREIGDLIIKRLQLNARVG